ncbi:hypothetical protein HQ535_04120 [bacterium]|nr:hypothetical protein [bacterium]
MTARCLTTGATSGIPHLAGECGAPACGIYARRSLTGIRGLRAAADSPGMVAGLVALTGTVAEHDSGYRAGMAQVLAAGSLWGDRLIVGWSASWVEALFEEPVATLSATGRPPEIGGPRPEVTAPLPGAGGRGASLHLLADHLEAIGAGASKFGLNHRMES